MINQRFSDIYSKDLAIDAIINNEFTGFKEDYLILHCLLRKYNPKSVFEIGTNMGRGTEIICNAVPDAKVYSLDLPTELAHISLQHPISEGKGDRVGHLCKRPFTQLRGDSLKFDYTPYPCDAYYIDGEHDYAHPYIETLSILRFNPQIVIYHDSDIPAVWRAIVDGMNEKYELYRVTDTRIAYLLKKDK